MTALPTYDRMMNPTLQALRDLGGSGTIEEIFHRVADIMDLSQEQLEVLHDPEKGSQTEVEYRLAWTRTYLKKYGLLENSSRGVWALTKEGRNSERVDPMAVKRHVRQEFKQSRAATEEAAEAEVESDVAAEVAAEAGWRQQLLDVLLEMEPDAFERLTQRLLRESGFTQVEVTGRSGDRGVDGKGILRVGGLISFHVIFQCKRYQGSVGAGDVRDFRGAWWGRAEKGLIITTGNFTRAAEWEATRDGVPAIDLIDGDLLAEKLKALSLGVTTRQVIREEVDVDRDWFLSI